MAADLGITGKWRAFEDLRRRLRALEDRRRAVDDSPADPRLRLRLGDAFRAIGRLDDALGQYREAAILFERLGFRRHAHAARILILKIKPDDEASLRDLRYASNLDRARAAGQPLDREVRALPGGSAGPLLALPPTVAARDTLPPVREEPAAPVLSLAEAIHGTDASAEDARLAAEREAPSARDVRPTSERPRPSIAPMPSLAAKVPVVSERRPSLKTFELLLGEDADDEIPPVVVNPNTNGNGNGHANGNGADHAKRAATSSVDAEGVNGRRVSMPPSDGVVVDIDMGAPEPPLMKGRPRPKDRRIDPRVEADGEVKIFRGADALGRLEDVSESGLFVSGPMFEPGTVLDVVIRSPEFDWLGLARVRVARAVPATRRRGAGIGLRILWADTPTERWIEEFVARSYGVDLLSALPSSNGDAKKMLDDRRRSFSRQSVSLPIVLVSEDFEVAGWALDLSMGGAFVQAPRVFGAGRRVEASIWLPGSEAPLQIASVVANARDGGTGIRFIRLSDEQEERLAKAL